jgi:hypothetical protein
VKTVNEMTREERVAGRDVARRDDDRGVVISRGVHESRYRDDARGGEREVVVRGTRRSNTDASSMPDTAVASC